MKRANGYKHQHCEPELRNKNIIMSFFKSSRDIQKKEHGPDRSVSNNQSSLVTLNELAEKAIIINSNFEFQQKVIQLI